jgi:uncharacterized lipoprotein YddW (UPF0748 family)
LSIRKLLICAPLLVALCVASCAAAEVRGAWVTSWSHGFFTPQEVDSTIAAAKKAGINALFIEVRKFADAYYDSKIEPRGSGMAPDFDALAYTIKQAHAEGIQVHAWVVVYRAWCGSKPGPKDPNHIVNKHPDWVLLDKDGKNWAGEGIYLDPGVPAARDYIVSVFEDIAKRYNVDGIQYDYVRYPGAKWGYSEAALKRYRAATGATVKPGVKDFKWLQWKRDQVTALVKLSHDRIKAANPKIAISASTICYGGAPIDFAQTSAYADVSQDWKQWMEDGLIDINIPMNYKPETTDRSKKSFRQWTDNSGKWGGKGVVYQGIDAEHQSAANMLTQIGYCRSVGQTGFVLFPFNAGKRRDEIAPVLGAGLGSAPRLAVNEVDSNSAARMAYDQGIKLAVAKQIAQAIDQFKKAIELDPTYADAYFRLGRCYLKEKDYPTAKAYFSKTLAVDSGYAAAQKELDLLAKEK